MKTLTRLAYLMALAMGPLIFSHHARACVGNCSAGATIYQSTYSDGSCEPGSSYCYYKACGGSCTNSQGNTCQPGPYTPGTCDFLAASCWRTSYVFCGCDYYCSH